jgi:hypothetical protein
MWVCSVFVVVAAVIVIVIVVVLLAGGWDDRGREVLATQEQARTRTLNLAEHFQTNS